MTITYSVHGWNENGNNIIVIVDIDDDKHPIAPVDAGAAGQSSGVAPDPFKGR